MTSCLPDCTATPFWKRVYSIRKEFAPVGSKFFPYRIDPFSERDKTILTIAFPEMYLFPLKPKRRCSQSSIDIVYTIRQYNENNFILLKYCLLNELQHVKMYLRVCTKLKLRSASISKPSVESFRDPPEQTVDAWHSADRGFKSWSESLLGARVIRYWFHLASQIFSVYVCIEIR